MSEEGLGHNPSWATSSNHNIQSSDRQLLAFAKFQISSASVYSATIDHDF